MKSVGCLLPGSIIGIVCLVVLAGPVQAEFVAELYGGGSFTNNADVDFTPNISGDAFSLHNVKFDTSWTAGGRIGYWFKEIGERGAFGVGLDVFAFKADANRQAVQVSLGGASLGVPLEIGAIEMTTIAIGFDLLRFRLHLAKSEELRQGRIQPYVSVGPAIFITEQSNENVFPAHQSPTKASVGVKAGAGLNLHVTPAWSLFGEYRFTHFTSEATFSNALPFAPSAQLTTNTDLNTHHIVGGIAFHF